MRVVWTPEAEQDRADIWDDIADDNPLAVVRMDLRFSDTAARLASHPKMGKAGRVPGTRELLPHEIRRRPEDRCVQRTPEHQKRGETRRRRIGKV